jgi:uncharacterized protein (TIGR02217 family)
MAGAASMLDQQIGIGDGLRTGFPLIKNYGGTQQVRRITRPKPASVIVAIDGIAAIGWSVVGNGIVTFENAPAPGAVVTAGYVFDVPVRFAEDRLEISRATFGAGDIASVPLIEIREAG